MPKEKSNTSHLRSLLGRVNIYSSVAVYIQIENGVRFAIASGKLKAGDQLPTIRELAEWLQINFNTVGKAYRDLEVMGLAVSRRGMGVFVNKGVEAKCREQCRKQTIARLFEVVAEAKAAGMAPAEVKEAARECYKAAAAPYAGMPKAVLALARKRR